MPKSSKAKLLPPDHPIFMEGVQIFTPLRFGRPSPSVSEDADHGTQHESAPSPTAGSRGKPEEASGKGAKKVRSTRRRRKD